MQVGHGPVLCAQRAHSAGTACKTPPYVATLIPCYQILGPNLTSVNESLIDIQGPSLQRGPQKKASRNKTQGGPCNHMAEKDV